MKSLFAITITACAVLFLSACGQTSSISFKGGRIGSGLPIAYAPGSGNSNGGMTNVTTANGNNASLSIGAGINQVQATSTNGVKARLNVIGEIAP